MAKGLLPLAKLLGLVTMSNGSEPINSQSYSLPLVPTSDRSKVCIYVDVYVYISLSIG